MSYETCVTVVLTALCALLAALAIIIGLAAIWGYSGIKEALTIEVRENADKALKEKLKEYPDAAEMASLHKRMAMVEGIRSQITVNAPVASPSKTGQDGAREDQTVAQDYPPSIGS